MIIMHSEPHDHYNDRELRADVADLYKKIARLEQIINLLTDKIDWTEEDF